MDEAAGAGVRHLGQGEPGPLPGRGRNLHSGKIRTSFCRSWAPAWGTSLRPLHAAHRRIYKGTLPPVKKLLLENLAVTAARAATELCRTFSPPQLRPRAKTVPRFIWKRPPGYVKPRSDLPLPPRDSRGGFQSRQRLGGVVIGESDDIQVGSGADLLEASASPSWDGFGFSDEHLDGAAAAGDWSTVAQFEASLVQP